MSNNSTPTAKIKDVYIQLSNYQFLHTPYDDSSEMKERFVGRQKVKDRIKTLLTNSISSAGTYLITGFRGMGKTSVLRDAIHELNGDGKSFRRRALNGFFKTAQIYKRLIWISFCLYLFSFVFNHSSTQNNDLSFIVSEGLNKLSLQTLIDFFVNHPWFALVISPILFNILGMIIHPFWQLAGQCYGSLLSKVEEMGFTSRQNDVEEERYGKRNNRYKKINLRWWKEWDVLLMLPIIMIIGQFVSKVPFFIGLKPFIILMTVIISIFILIRLFSSFYSIPYFPSTSWDKTHLKVILLGFLFIPYIYFNQSINSFFSSNLESIYVAGKILLIPGLLYVWLICFLL